MSKSKCRPPRPADGEGSPSMDLRDIASAPCTVHSPRRLRVVSRNERDCASASTLPRCDSFIGTAYAIKAMGSRLLPFAATESRLRASPETQPFTCSEVLDEKSPGLDRTCACGCIPKKAPEEEGPRGAWNKPHLPIRQTVIPSFQGPHQINGSLRL